jgi:predicted GIY-YIG superfamily endonuclease
VRGDAAAAVHLPEMRADRERGIMTDDRERVALYRIRGEDDELIYIGITNSISVRWNGHQAVQPWWDEVRSLTVEWYDTRVEAERAEKAAILAEQPKYNVTYLKPGNWRDRKRPGVQPIDWEGVALEPRADDEDLLNMSDIAQMIRVTSTTTALNALRRTGGPEGFEIVSQRVFRKGEVRAWLAALEAAQPGGRAVDEAS